MRAKYLICYDISNERRLARVFKLMKGVGVHLQYSVFLCSFTWVELNDIKERLDKLIDQGKDDIRIYPLPSGAKVTVFGKGARVPEGVELYVYDGFPLRA